MPTEMTMRDHVAAAALTGLLAGRKFTALDDAIVAEAYAEAAYGMADAMLRERERTNHDAAPAARASEATASPERVRVRGDAGTGDTPAMHATPPQGIEPREGASPQPTLTDAEREAVATAARIAGAVGEDDIKATLRGLLERLGGGR